mmetsp:Transcript_46460/g.115235  ORF Transcript_46460/g.115235 Transcript_46460/m.115235 type:complete len:277 (+) Transcript_46460:292-1122(+)
MCALRTRFLSRIVFAREANTSLRRVCLLVQLDQLLLFVTRARRVVLVLHRVLSLPLRRAAEVVGVAEHALQRHLRGDRAELRPLNRADRPLALRELRDSAALVLGRHRDLHLHDRLEQHRLPSLDRLLEPSDRRGAEGELTRVDGVRRAVLQDDAHSHHRAACERALLHRLAEAFVDRRDELGRDVVARELIDKLEAARAEHLLVERLDVPLHLAELPRAARLLLVSVREGRAPAEGLAVRHLGRAGRALGAVLALHPLHVDLQVELAHARDDRVA